MRLRELGLSISAIQSSKQSSCATRAHGHGERQSEVSGVSSVSSAKHIQHFLTSSSACGGGWGVVEAGGLELDAGDGGFRRTVCESSETVDRA